MRMYVKLFLSVIIFILTSSTLFSQTVIKYPLQDSGTEIGAGIAVRLNSSGQIVVCDSNDVNIIGFIIEKENVSGTIYYNVVNSDATEAFLRAGVNMGDKLTVAAGGTLKILQPSEMIVGFALEDGPASGAAQRGKIMITLDAALTGNFIWNQDTSAQLGNYWISGDSKTNGSDSIGGNLTVEGAAVINDAGGANDFRVEGFTDQNLIFTDAANNRLGIGTNAPTAKLDVNGQTRIRTVPSGLTTDSILTVDANGNIRSINFNRIEDNDWTRSGNLLYTYNTSDSVGIGTTSPGAKLDVRGDAVFNEDGGDFDFRVEGFTDQNLIFTDAANDWLGIGTNAPTAKLDVNGQARIRTVPSGLTTDSILTVDANGNIRSINFNRIEDDDWSRNNNYVYTYNTDDSVGIGLTSPDNKLDIDGGVLMHGNRYWGVDPSGTDSFWIYDDRDTTFFNADNPITIGDLSLILQTDGDARITKHLYIETVDEDSITDSVLVLTSGGKVSWASREIVTSVITRGYAEIYIGDTLGKAVSLPAHCVWTTMDSASSGEVAGSPYITTHTSSGSDSVVIGTKGETIYQMNMSISFSGPSGVELAMGLFLNDSLLQEFILYSDIASSGETKSGSLSGLIPLKTDNALTIKMKNRNDRPISLTIEIYNFCLQLTRIEF